MPNGVAVEAWEQLPSLLAPGQPVAVKDGQLLLVSGALKLQLHSVPKETNTVSPDEMWLQEGVNLLIANRKETGLSSLVYPLFTEQTPELNPYCRVALPHVRALLQGLKEDKTEEISPSVCALMGLGPGLTPSGDDLLSGLVYGLRHSPIRDSAACNTLITTIREFAPERTNAVSADYLLAMADDAPFALMAEAWKDPAAGAALMQIGSNSGSEMLLGLLCAGSVLCA